MSQFKSGDRVRIDERPTDENWPFTGVVRLLRQASGHQRLRNMPGIMGSILWEVEVECLEDSYGEKVAEPGETYSVFEYEIVGVLSDDN